MRIRSEREKIEKLTKRDVDEIMHCVATIAGAARILSTALDDLQKYVSTWAIETWPGKNANSFVQCFDGIEFLPGLPVVTERSATEPKYKIEKLIGGVLFYQLATTEEARQYLILKETYDYIDGRPDDGHRQGGAN